MSKLIAFLAAALLSVTAFAGDKDKKDHSMKSSAATFDSLDKNGDGKISLTEASNDDALFVAFKSLDGDKDGELTREEFAKYK